MREIKFRCYYELDWVNPDWKEMVYFDNSDDESVPSKFNHYNDESGLWVHYGITTDKNGRVYVYLSGDYCDKEVRISDYSDDIYNIMQYTEFEDINGVGIFAGDIIDFTVYDYRGYATYYRGYVYIDKYGRFIKTSLEEDEFTESFDFVEVVVCDGCVEVVGNIYENPELLDEER